MSGDEPLEPDPAGPGPTLKAARESIDVSRREVAQALNLSVDTLAAIEEDDFDAMPELVFTRGYVRNYAKLLDLDPEPLVALLHNEPTTTTRMPALESRGLTGVQKRIIAGVLALLAVVVLLVVIVVQLSGGDEAEAEAEAPSAVSEALEAPEPQMPIPQEQPLPEANEGTDEAKDVASAVIADAEAEEEYEAEIADEVDAEAVESVELPGVAEENEGTVVPSSARRITDTGDDEIELEFAADCWIEIRNLEGERLFSRMGSASRPYFLVGQAPFRIRLGYAPGVTLRFNGEVVPLVPHTVDNIANLVVGQ